MVVGGVEIPYHSGPEGHSDADVLLHAICDALLGAAALGDIGTRFPDDDRSYKDIQSILLLAKVYQLLSDEGYRIVNIDATVVLEAPSALEIFSRVITLVEFDRIIFCNCVSLTPILFARSFKVKFFS